jgi:hypothetical protein
VRGVEAGRAGTLELVTTDDDCCNSGDAIEDGENDDEGEKNADEVADELSEVGELANKA